MCMRRCLVGLPFCTCYLASYLTNKYVLSVLKFTYPTLFQGWQTLIGGLLLHVSSRSDVLTWLPASVLFVGIICAGSRALSRLAIPVFLILHNVAEVIICGHQKCFQKEKTSPAKICSALFLLASSHAATKKSTCCNEEVRMPQLKIPCASTNIPPAASKTQCGQNK
uniref:Transmembrane protein 241 n=1 Tax=Balaenoptera musculus TaxID=9771 RepID=A0A8C0HVV2_BALMU